MDNKILQIAFFILLTIPVCAQKSTEDKPFLAYLINKEYSVYLRINFYEQDIKVPGQELYGPLPGYLGKEHNSFCWVITSCKLKGDDSFCWVITSCKLKGDDQAEMQLINDFGSEDLRATLTRKNDSLYVLKQGSGSTIKVPHQGKWRKLPGTLIFTRK